MWTALSFAFIDSVNALLIAVIVAIGILMPRQYPKAATMLLLGDWTGVSLLSFVVMFIFRQVQGAVARALSSPVFGILLIVTGLLLLVTSYRSKDDDAQTQKIVSYMSSPYHVFGIGVILGVVQSLASVPFFNGIAILSTILTHVWASYLSMLVYATIALSLPTACAIAFSRVDASSWPTHNIGKITGYALGAFLAIVGVFSF